MKIMVVTMLVSTTLVFAVAQVDTTNPPLEELREKQIPSSPFESLPDQRPECLNECNQKCENLVSEPLKYSICFQTCIKMCNMRSFTPDVYSCALGCVESISTGAGPGGDHKLGEDHIDTCYNNCKRMNN
ncbi:hypothetical protein CJ030_MR7G028044 [Morella rubra]|uniref:Protein TAP1 n=1 Tax=Morella rubra TaxID=262757 RepID=A0A6A1UZK7_9ROSI|nr:hypothetical protein CJ030_MR7G028044 [Morella rubra]